MSLKAAMTMINRIKSEPEAVLIENLSRINKTTGKMIQAKGREYQKSSWLPLDCRKNEKNRITKSVSPKNDMPRSVYPFQKSRNERKKSRDAKYKLTGFREIDVWVTA